ncbi:LysR family transcriptional regulator [Nonomuraea dietziae]|uniref:LysR family transcriptional regulator n=1 Tax=Nonomuraea dietziae TaxID=65515 RepID=UPI0031D146F5
MELRDIEIFLTLAEELHFTRTADRLRVSPARISQAIRKQERAVGAKLFERTSRSVRLTAIGERLYDDLRPAFRELREGMQRAKLAAQGGSEALRVGMLPGNAYDLRPYWEAFRVRHPQWTLRIRHNPFIGPFAPLRNGDVDVLVSWLPVEEPDLTVGPVVFTEPRVLLAALGHELSEHASVSIEALGDFGVLGPSAPLPDYWEDAFIPFQTPSGRPVARGPGRPADGRHPHHRRHRGVRPPPGRSRHAVLHPPRHQVPAHPRCPQPAVGPRLAQRRRVSADPRPGSGDPRPRPRRPLNRTGCGPTEGGSSDHRRRRGRAPACRSLPTRLTSRRLRRWPASRRR